MHYSGTKFHEPFISCTSKITRDVINSYVRRLKLQNEACRKLIAPLACQPGIYEAGFCAIPAKIDQKSLNKCGGRIVERAKNTGIVVSPPVTRLSCGAEKRGPDIRSNVESVTRFSVIESKISLKNERRSRCISALVRGNRARGAEGRGGEEAVGNARKTRFRSPRV